mgnify:FL=1
MATVHGSMAYVVRKGGAKHIGNAIIGDSMIDFIDAPTVVEAARRIFRKLRNVPDDRLTLRFWYGNERRIVYVYLDGRLIGYFVDRKQ